MPRFVRPFWIDGRVNGKEAFATGPRSLDPSDASFTADVRMRDHGDIAHVLSISGYRDAVSGKLRLCVYGPDRALVFQHETEV